MIVTCLIQIAINAGGLPIITTMAVTGKVKNNINQTLIVDFSEGVADLPLVGKPTDYKNVVVPKSDCEEVV